MCFFTNIVGKKPAPKIAKKDIICWKVIGRESKRSKYYDLKINGQIESWVKGTHYLETKPFQISRSHRSQQWIISGRCFHSFKDKPKYGLFGVNKIHFLIIKTIIPKKALYYENDMCYVSSEIIYP